MFIKMENNMLAIICTCRDTNCPVSATTANVRGAYCGRKALMELRHPTNINRYNFPEYKHFCEGCGEHAIKNGWEIKDVAQFLKDYSAWIQIKMDGESVKGQTPT